MRTPTYRNVHTNTDTGRVFIADTATVRPITTAPSYAAITGPAVTYAAPTARARRRMARSYRRAYRGTTPRLVTRIAGWVMLGVSVATISGIGAVMAGRTADDMHRDPAPTYTYEWSRTCPTEDSCDQFGHPIVP